MYNMLTFTIALQLKIRNDFDPVLSPESSLFILKSNKKVRYLSVFINYIMSQDSVHHGY